jgi:outer membrane protein, multidrug efflux system
MVKSMLTCLAALLTAAAGSAAPLTVADAVRLAADEAPAVVGARADTELALARASGARSRLGPALTADVGYFGTNDPSGVFRLQLLQERFSASEFFASNPNDPPFTRDWSAAAAVEWTADVSGERRAELDAATGSAAAAGRRTRRTRDTVAFQVVAAFGSARAAEDALALLARREEDAREDVRIATSMREQGLATAADPARAAAALAELHAEIAARAAALSQARATLATLVGPDAAARPLAPLPGFERPPDGVAAARDDVAAADLAAASARDRRRAASASRLPELVVSGRYDLHAERPGGRWGDSASIAGGIRVPLFASGAVRSRIREAQAAAASAEAAAEATRRAAASEAASARAALEASEARLAAFEEAGSAARQAREIQEARYREGVSRLADLIDARAAELGAGIGAATARADRAVAAARLRLALGLPPEGSEP